MINSRPIKHKYEEIKKYIVTAQEDLIDKNLVVFKLQKNKFSICKLKNLWKQPQKLEKQTGCADVYETIHDGNYSDRYGCHLYLDLDCKNPRKNQTPKIVCPLVEEYVRRSYKKYVGVDDIDALRFFWTTAPSSEKLSLHLTCSHTEFLWKYSDHATDQIHSQKSFVKLMVNDIMKDNSEILITSENQSNEIVECIIDLAPYNSRGNQSMRMALATKDRKRKLFPLTREYDIIPEKHCGKNVLENHIITCTTVDRSFFEIYNRFIEKKTVVTVRNAPVLTNNSLPDDIDFLLEQVENTSIAEVDKNLIKLKTDAPRYCPIAKRIHDSVGCYLSIHEKPGNAKNKVLYHCHSATCKDVPGVPLRRKSQFKCFTDHRKISYEFCNNRNGFVLNKAHLNEYMREVFTFIENPDYPEICMRRRVKDDWGNYTYQYRTFPSNNRPNYPFPDRMWIEAPEEKQDDDGKKKKKRFTKYHQTYSTLS